MGATYVTVDAQASKQPSDHLMRDQEAGSACAKTLRFQRF